MLNNFLRIFKVASATYILLFLMLLTTHTVSAITAESCWVTKVGEPAGDKPICKTSSGSSGVCAPAPAYTSGDIVTEIKDKWGIVLVSIPQDQLVAIREIFYEIDCTGFLQDLGQTRIVGTGVQNGVSQQFSCPPQGIANGDADIRFSIYSPETTKGLILHEMTHVWQFCTPNGEANLLEAESAYKAEGGLTKYSRQECSLRPGNDRIYHEDQADTIALYLNPTVGELTCGNGAPNPFAGGAHPLHNAAAAKGVGSK